MTSKRHTPCEGKTGHLPRGLGSAGRCSVPWLGPGHVVVGAEMLQGSLSADTLWQDHGVMHTSSAAAKARAQFWHFRQVRLAACPGREQGVLYEAQGLGVPYLQIPGLHLLDGQYEKPPLDCSFHALILLKL